MKVEDFLDSQSDEEDAKSYRPEEEKRDESCIESSVCEIRVEVAVNDDAQNTSDSDSLSSHHPSSI